MPAVAASTQSVVRAEPQLLHSVQILRFVAAFVVVLVHVRIAQVEVLRAPDPAIDRIFDLGAVGVHLFFLISGFVMVLTALPHDQPMRATTFLRRRFTRIFPIYWVLALASLATHALLGTPYALGIGEFVGAMLLLPDHSSKIIGPGWTLAYEVYFYLCFGIALTLGRRLGMILLPAFFVGSIALSVLVPGVGRIMGIAGNALLLEFLAGAAVGLMWLRGVRLPVWTGLPLIVIGVSGLLAGLPLGYERLPLVLAWGVPCMPILIGALTLEPRLRGPVATWFAMLGNSSYFLYLVHILIIHLIFLAMPARLLGGAADIVAIPVVVAAICVVIAKFGHDVIERPLISLVGATMKRLGAIATGRRVASSA